MDVAYDKTTPAVAPSLLYNAQRYIDKKNDITISRRKKNTSWNIIVAIFIYITMDVEHNETTPAIIFSTFHEDSDVSVQNDVRIYRKTLKNTYRRI